jgi:hypothetical protein
MCEVTDEQYEYNMPLMDNLNGSCNTKSRGQDENNLDRQTFGLWSLVT